MSNHYDVIIIGAGPAGIAAGITLQKNGISNAVIDKRSFPRKKTCGGLITDKTLKVLMKLLGTTDIGSFSDVFCDSDNVVEIFYRDKKLTHSEVELPLHFVRRESFDLFLVEKYKETGGCIFEGEKNYSADIKKKSIVLSDGDKITFDYIFIADGALSPTAKKIGMNTADNGFCVETHISKKDIRDPEGVKIFFGLVKSGYAWCFPSGKDVCVGLGGVYKKKTDYKKKLDEFLKLLGADTLKKEYKGAFVPYGATSDQSEGPDNVLLLGDAGGFVDPISGEGIYFAISSGMEAANAFINGKERNIDIKMIYLKNTAGFTKIIKQGEKLKRRLFFYPLQRIFKNKIKNKDFFVKFYCDRQISDYNYDYSHIMDLYFDYKKELKKHRKKSAF